MTEYLTHNLPGTGGTIKESPEDFYVEEIPLYLPCGEGEHLYLHVEKVGLTTHDLLHKLAKAFRVPERELGYAGLKDARATTRQYISLPGVHPEQANDLQMDGIRILQAVRHRNKLRLGHLAGNRFNIRIRGAGENSQQKAETILGLLTAQGVPNRFGSQRYGILGNSHWIGQAILQGDFALAGALIIGDPALIKNERWRQAAEAYRQGDLNGALEALPPRMRNERALINRQLKTNDSRQAVLNLPRKLLRLYLSAYQSDLFDRLIATRLESLGTLRQGDLAYKHDNGACFTVETPELEQERADRFEISPTGPLFGYKVRLADGGPGETERALLSDEGIELESFRLSSGLSMEGERRPLRVPLSDVSVHLDQNDLKVGFALPRGSYATSVLREIMKNDPASPPMTSDAG